MPERRAARPPRWVFRLLLRCYPRSFRARFGGDLQDVHADRWAEAGRRRGWWGLTLYALRASGQMVRDGLGERLSVRAEPPLPAPRRDRVSSVLHDVRYALRSLRKDPVFGAGVVLTLALGVGANAAIFSVVDGVLLRRLPYPEPDRLVRVWEADTESGDRFVELSYDDYAYIKQHATTVSDAAAFSRVSRDLVDAHGRPREVVLGRVADGLFALLGAHPILGRDFQPDDLRRSIPVVLLSHALWTGRYGADPHILGETVHIRTQPFTVVGVLPPGSGYPLTADLWRPLVAERQDEDREFHVIARLAPGATVEDTSAEIRVLAQQLQRLQPRFNQHITAWVQPMRAMVVRNVRAPLLVLLGAVGFVLLIACANVANLLLARGAGRRREVAIRTALGASRGRVARQLLTEGLVLAVLGGVAGLFAGYWALHLILAVIPPDTPRIAEVALDGRVAAVMAVVIVLAGTAFGTLPALQGSKSDLQADLRGKAPARAGNPFVRRLQQILVMAEVSLATVLTIGATLLMTSFTRMLHLERGFTTENVLIVPVEPGTLHLGDRAIALFEDAQARLGSVPGVRSVELSTMNPVDPRGLRTAIQLTSDADPRADPPVVRWHSVTPDFFRTMGIRLTAGRPLDGNDNETAPRVVLVNEAFVHALLPGRDPVGTRLYGPPVEIVGVVGDVTPQAGSIPTPTMFSPFRQMPVPGLYAIVRSTADPVQLVEAVREQVWAIDPTIPLDDITTVERAIADTVASPRVNMLLVAVFAGVALILASVGIYGVMSHAVSQRTRELGLRRALGAVDGNILGMVMRQGLGLAAAGVAVGLLLASWLTRLLTAQLYGVSATDPAIFGAIGLLLGAVAATACYLPARRATRTDPMTALRYE